MRCWLSTWNVRTFYGSLLEGGYPCYLGSFFEGQPLTKFMQESDTMQRFQFFLDSGAYSAWSRGVEIDIDEYVEFIKANADHLDVYANLDALAGKPGQVATLAQRNEGAARSWANFLYMRSEGLDPLPVFHVGESWSWLDKMLAHGCDYIGLGGLVGCSYAERKAWLDQVFERLCDERGHPKVKTHGFGMTSIPLMFRYPWHSVDSTTWIQVAANGAVIMPAVRGNEFAFDMVPTIVSVSSSKEDLKSFGTHTQSLNPQSAAVVERWLAMCGKTLQQVTEHYSHRATCNVRYFKMVSECKAAGELTFKPRGTVGLW